MEKMERLSVGSLSNALSARLAVQADAGARVTVFSFRRTDPVSFGVCANSRA